MTKKYSDYIQNQNFLEFLAGYMLCCNTMLLDEIINAYDDQNSIINTNITDTNKPHTNTDTMDESTNPTKHHIQKPLLDYLGKK